MVLSFDKPVCVQDDIPMEEMRLLDAGGRTIHFVQKDMDNLEDPIPKKNGLEMEWEEQDVETTNWRAVFMVGIITFLSALEGTVVGMSEWPYMHTIDPDATSQFFGYVASISKGGHAISTLLFSYWSYRKQCFRAPLVFSRILAFMACCVYLCVEFLPTGRRYLMLLCYFLFGSSGAATCIMRVYLVSISASKDRSRAFSVIVMANMLSIVVGPIIQMSFTFIKYPGFALLTENIRFHIYSAPIWIASLTNFISIAVICCGLDELPRRQKSKKVSIFTMEGFKERLHKMSAMELRWPLVYLCWTMKVIIQLSVITIVATASPIMMSSFGWTGAFTVQMTSISMGTVGVLSISLALAYMTGILGKLISSRMALLIGLSITISMYILSYPYPFVGHPIPAYNETLGTGCNPLEYSWCGTEVSTNPTVFLGVITLVIGIAMPLTSISVDTIYSKVLGNIDQSIMQGVIVFIEDLIQVVGPIYAASMFTLYGQNNLWILNALVTMACTTIWLYFYRDVKPYC